MIRAYLRTPVVFLLVRTEHWRMEERNLLIEQVPVARNANIVCNDQREENAIVGNACAHAAARRRMPPVLHVAFLELPGRRTHDLCPRFLRRAVNDRHCILELVTETECPTRLIERGPAPHSTRERLVHEPTV